MTIGRIDERYTYEPNGSKWDKRVNLQGGTSDGYASGSDAWRYVNANPEWTHYAGETLADVTNGTDGTYYYYLDMATFRQLGLQFVLNGGSGTVTLTVEASLQDDGTAPASVAYKDITNAVFGSASFTASDLVADNARVLASAKWVRVKVVAASGSNDADWTIFSRRSW